MTLRLPLAALALSLAALGSAFPPYWEEFKKEYRPQGALLRAQCLTCHAAPVGGKRNSYGQAVQAKLAGRNALTGAILVSVEAGDADGDGVTNGEEIRRGTLPGDPKSKPAASAAPAEPAKTEQKVGTGLIPKNAWHPFLVHFPLGIFLFGAALDLAGMAWRRADWRGAAYWSLLGGALASLLALPTGLLAANRLGYALTPGTTVFLHLWLSVGSSLAMLGVALWRRGREPQGLGYVAFLALAAGLLLAAGHYGGQLVHGT